MATSQFPRVTGFAVTGTLDDPIVCVHVEAGALEVWIGRRYPGLHTEVITDTGNLQPISAHAAHKILSGWPATQDDTTDALQFAAWHGRRELIGARLHERVVSIPTLASREPD